MSATRVCDARDRMTKSDRNIAAWACVVIGLFTWALGAITVGGVVALGVRDGGLSEGAFTALVAVMVLAPMCFVSLRLEMVAHYWEHHPREQSSDAVKEWREALRAPIAVATAIAMGVTLALVAGWTKTELPSSTFLGLLGFLGLGTLVSLPAAWMGARNVATETARSLRPLGPWWFRAFIVVMGLLLAWGGFQAGAEPAGAPLPQQPSSYCYSAARVTELAAGATSQKTNDSAVPAGKLAPDTYCFTSPLPSPGR